MSHKEAARIIGLYFTDIQDKLLNILQLQELSDSENELVQASIDQKSSQLKPFKFANAIDFKNNLKYVKYVAFPIIVLMSILLSGNKEVILKSSERIISYNKEYVAKAPFEFIIQNEKLEVIKNQNFVLRLKITGNEIPNEVYIVFNNNSFLMNTSKKGIFEFKFRNIQQTTTFQFKANSFFSTNYKLNVIAKPIVSKIITEIKPPKYLNLKNETFENKGNIYLHEGSTVMWRLEVENAEKIFIQIGQSKTELIKNEDNIFNVSKKIFESNDYQFISSNKHTKGDSLFYRMNVIKDAYPLISTKEIIDSTDLMLRFVNGQIEDDFGISRLSFNYKIISDSTEWQTKNIDIQKQVSSQLFSFLINFEELSLNPGDGIAYFFEVWDNDEVNGSKASRTSKKQYLSPSEEDIEKDIEQQNDLLKEKIKNSQELARQIQEDMQELNKQLLKQKEIGWEEKNKVKELVKKQEQLQNEIQKIEEIQKQNQNKDNKLNSKSEDLLKKQEQIQELFENIMDQEMKQMMEELNKLMDDVNKEELKNLLNQMEQKDEDVEKELDRTLELFKQLEIEQKLEQNADKLLKLADKQKKLALKGKEKSVDKKTLEDEQTDIQKEFEQISEELESTKKDNQKLENKKNIPETKEQEQNILQDMQKSIDKLQNNLKKQAAKLQNNAAQQMEEMSQAIKQAMETDEAETVAEDMETLRQILENLIIVSYDQEQLMTDIYDIKFNSPIYTEHLRTQKTLQENTQIIEDSLFALSKRQPQIESIINKEINAINNNMENALAFMEERKSYQATEKQQFAMMAANNLALLLSEILEQMQQQMANKQNKPSGKMCNKPKSVGGESMKKMKEMQQKIKEQMKSMLQGKQGKDKNGGKQSKKIAQMAAQQEQIRNRLKELRNELSGDQQSKNNLDKLLDQLEENQTDILNNNITQSTLIRQEKILTRLLQAEKAELEKEKEKQRESNEWLNNLSNKILDPIELYKQEKKNQEELIRTIPPSLMPFYKNKVNQYFKNNE